MTEEFCQVLISATSKREANKISDSLIQKKLVAGALIARGLARYWWNDRIVKKAYYNISAFSLLRNKTKIISEVKKIHSDKCPIIAFSKVEGNKEFLDWVKEFCK